MGVNAKRLRKLEQQRGRDNGNYDGIYGHIMFCGIDRTLEILKNFREARGNGVSIMEPPPFKINSDTERQLLRDLKLL